MRAIEPRFPLPGSGLLATLLHLETVCIRAIFQPSSHESVQPLLLVLPGEEQVLVP